MTGRRILLLLVLVWTLFPLYWQLATSLKGDAEIWQIPPRWWPAAPTVDHYVSIFREHPFGRFIANSLLVAAATTVAVLILGFLAASASEILHLPGRKVFLAMVLGISFLPPVTLAPALFVAFRAAGLLDTYWALLLPYVALSLPLAVWNLAAFLRQIPAELPEAALLDGATPPQLLRHVILPLAAPGLAATAILTFMAAANEFFFALIFLSRPELRTAPVGIALLPGQYTAPWGEISAASVVVVLPLLLITLLCQRWIVAGLMTGSTKG